MPSREMEKSLPFRDPPSIAPAPTRTWLSRYQRVCLRPGGPLAIGEVAVPVDSENLASESSPKCSKLMLNTTSEMAIAPSLGKLPTPAPLYCAVMSPTKLALPRPTFGQAEIWTWRVSGKDSSRIDVAREHLSFPRARLEGSSLRRPTRR
jgi:hypothetical protein